jgi:hypothetical protein
MNHFRIAVSSSVHFQLMHSTDLLHSSGHSSSSSSIPGGIPRLDVELGGGRRAITAANISLFARAESFPCIGPEDEDNETSGPAMPSSDLY